MPIAPATVVITVLIVPGLAFTQYFPGSFMPVAVLFGLFNALIKPVLQFLVLRFIFGSLTLLFFLLALRDWLGSEAIGRLAGYEGIVCGASACYLAMAEVLEEQYGRKILPVG